MLYVFNSSVKEIQSAYKQGRKEKVRSVAEPITNCTNKTQTPNNINHNLNYILAVRGCIQQRRSGWESASCSRRPQYQFRPKIAYLH
jgi:hypothetical protein